MADDDEPYYFRGTSSGYAGNPALLMLGITPVSTDPVVATIFAIASSRFASGVVHIATARDLAGINTLPGNVLASLECEVAIEILPAEFARRAGCTLTVLQARGLLRGFGVALPARIDGPAAVDAALRSSPRFSVEQLRGFVTAARQLATQ